MHTQVSINPRHMRDVVGRFCTGVTVIAGHDGFQPLGFTLQSFMSLSLEPSLIAISPNRTSRTWQEIRETGAFTVNILSAEQEQVSRIFASRTLDRFENLEWSYGATGSPRIEGCSAWIDCVIRDEHDGGDHTLVVAEVHALDASELCAPLLFNQGSYGILGLRS